MVQCKAALKSMTQLTALQTTRVISMTTLRRQSQVVVTQLDLHRTCKLKLHVCSLGERELDSWTEVILDLFCIYRAVNCFDTCITGVNPLPLQCCADSISMPGAMSVTTDPQYQIARLYAPDEPDYRLNTYCK